MRKKFTFLFIFILLPALLLSENKKQSFVQKQHQSDINRINKIIKKFEEFKEDINKKAGTNKIEIDSPIDADHISDIKKIDHFHSNKKILTNVFAYVNINLLDMRSLNNFESDIVGQLKFKEKVEVLAQSDTIDEYNNIKSNWILVKKLNSEEGWVFGAFLQKNKPEKKEDIKTIEKRSISSKEFMVPVIGKISSRYGYRVHPITKKRDSFHSGIDIAASKGTPVKAAADGIVKISEFHKRGYGNLIVIDHGKNFFTYYGHLSKRLALKGKQIKKGDIIGKVGSTGSTTGPHLHFEVRRGDTAINPDDYLF